MVSQQVKMFGAWVQTLTTYILLWLWNLRLHPLSTPRSSPVLDCLETMVTMIAEGLMRRSKRALRGILPAVETARRSTMDRGGCTMMGPTEDLLVNRIVRRGIPSMNSMSMDERLPCLNMKNLTPLRKLGLLELLELLLELLVPLHFWRAATRSQRLIRSITKWSTPGRPCKNLSRSEPWKARARFPLLVTALMRQSVKLKAMTN